jgi:hypothetical protein
MWLDACDMLCYLSAVVSGARALPPQYDHHVDDNLYADIQQSMRLTVSASILALYDVLGFPSVDVPDPMSPEKFNTKYSHLRKTLGYHINTRCLVVGILPHKREQMRTHLLACYVLRYS